MKFWDASAIVPLCLTEPQSAVVKTILVKDTSLVVWWATRTECVSALVRQTREGGLSLDDEKKARQVLGALAKAWLEVRPTETLRLAAERLLAVHPLRAADGFQLAAALQVIAEGKPRMHLLYRLMYGSARPLIKKASTSCPAQPLNSCACPHILLTLEPLRSSLVNLCQDLAAIASTGLGTLMWYNRATFSRTSLARARGGKVPHVPGHHLTGMGPGGIAVGIVTGPHAVVNAPPRQRVAANRIVEKGRVHLAMEVLARQLFEREAGAVDAVAFEVIVPLLQDKRDPANLVFQPTPASAGEIAPALQRRSSRIARRSPGIVLWLTLLRS